MSATTTKTKPRAKRAAVQSAEDRVRARVEQAAEDYVAAHQILDQVAARDFLCEPAHLDVTALEREIIASVYPDVLETKLALCQRISRQRAVRALWNRGVGFAAIAKAEQELEEATSAFEGTEAKLEDIIVNSTSPPLLERQIERLSTLLEELDSRRRAAEARLRSENRAFQNLCELAPERLKEAVAARERAIWLVEPGSTLKSLQGRLQFVKEVVEKRQREGTETRLGGWETYVNSRHPELLDGHGRIDRNKLGAHLYAIETEELPRLRGEVAELTQTVEGELRQAREPLHEWVESRTISVETLIAAKI